MRQKTCCHAPEEAVVEEKERAVGTVRAMARTDEEAQEVCECKQTMCRIVYDAFQIQGSGVRGSKAQEMRLKSRWAGWQLASRYEEVSRRSSLLEQKHNNWVNSSSQHTKATMLPLAPFNALTPCHLRIVHLVILALRKAESGDRGESKRVALSGRAVVRPACPMSNTTFRPGQRHRLWTSTLQTLNLFQPQCCWGPLAQA
ncbi:hypothetical protein BGZ60DRAFT_531430 [Tricladium varicosporioides]|nr:hypothetical protein BGZ60DRAFT_531430 [Hymenoscyphus varicosporioides]